MEKNVKHFEIHTEEIQDLIGRPPSRTIVYGNLVVGSIITMLILISFFLKFPDIVTAPVTITSSSPPIKLFSNANGMITQLFVKDGSQVKKGQIIASIDNTASTEDMKWLTGIVNILDTSINLKGSILNLKTLRNIQVGDVQEDYANLFHLINNFQFINNNRYYKNKKAIISEQSKIQKLIDSKYNNREDLLKKQLQIEAWRDSINELLVVKKIISASEYNDIKKQHLNQHINSFNNQANQLSNIVQLKEYEKNVTDLDQQNKVDQNQALSLIKDELQKIRAKILAWEKFNIIKAPVDGNIVFFKIWKVNQYVNAGTPVFVIAPKMYNYQVKADLQIFQSGKVHPGQRVFIKLREYPYEEFGILSAKVNTLSSVSLDSIYSVDMMLTNGLKTTLNQKIDKKPVIMGTAEIVTNNKSIFQRIFEVFYKAIN